MPHDPKTFDWWKDAMKSVADGTGQTPYPPIYNDTPMTGTYAYRPSKNDAPKPVFFWYVDGALRTKVDNQNVKYGDTIWPGCSRFPIDRPVYDSVIAGNPWPHEIVIRNAAGDQVDSTLAKPGHNSGDADADIMALKGNAAEWADRLKAAVKKGRPTTKEDADALADMTTKLNDLVVEIERRRLKVTEPLHRAWKAEVEIWKDYIPPNAETLVANGRSLCRAFVKVEEARLAAEQAAAQRAAREAQEAAATGAPVESIEALLPPPEATVAPVRVGTRGKTIGSKTRTKVVEFSDFKAAATFFINMAKVDDSLVDAVRALAHRLLTAGAPVPGATLKDPE